ncbi:hypothetical protein BABINDRAFT_167831 [Babjeviella inositovora NRRL Y-12698]|uniref:Zn(2)-C6 fungal-type domain-containing protein n=1 Tax=Babjeviella inositovora NRRL Y-12698 TaxID=984486 RepID=A0A1E3QLY0_9ASCO|nr:uncharacterized protein BABINDRAFT_167831 [Babjeviella inositovora NRRL Y-12698]ODQ78628.1 hypothetical protein BABINDRAFT_167831 [Babjeviella inositovora NRRL Y-12698]
MTDPASTAKTIKTHGSQYERVAQACDRCRAKKTKCDGKKPCTNCSLVGFECKISDKLSRRAFPRGYTETLEERIRMLEVENKKLLGLLDLKDEQLLVVQGLGEQLSDTSRPQRLDKPPGLGEPVSPPLSSSNLSRLNQLSAHPHRFTAPQKDHTGENCCANYPHSFQERTISWSDSVDIDNGRLSSDTLNSDKELHDISLRGAAFAISMSRVDPAARANAHGSSEPDDAHCLALLVANCLPRSTEEVLFTPTIMAKIGEYHGYDSRAATLTARALAGLKDYIPATPMADHDLFDVNFRQGQASWFWKTLSLPLRIVMDQLITQFVQEWNAVLPIVDEADLFAKYKSEEFQASYDSNFGNFGPDEDTDVLSGMQSFGVLLVFICAFGLLSRKLNIVEAKLGQANSQVNGQARANISSEITPEESLRLLNHYDALIHEFIRNPTLTAECSLQSLTFLNLALNYCCNVGDVSSACQLRARMVAVTHQLRLHRCPSAVLSIRGAAVDRQSQGARRVLFWCSYSLDCFLSMILGVPRLFKDYEIECALPAKHEQIVKTSDGELRLEGTVNSLGLSIICFSRIIGCIIDNIYRRHGADGGPTLFRQENMLETWRKQLPQTLKFGIDVNGLLKTDLSTFRTWQQILVIFLYYQARILIYFPLMAEPEGDQTSSETGARPDAGQAASEAPAASGSKLTTSFIVIQQSAIQILSIFTYVNSKHYHFPIPWSPSHIQARLAIIAARGVLEYSRGGALFNDLRSILTALITHLKRPSEFVSSGGDLMADLTVPGSFSVHVSGLIEQAIDAILAVPGKEKEEPEDVFSASNHFSFAKKARAYTGAQYKSHSRRDATPASSQYSSAFDIFSQKKQFQDKSGDRVSSSSNIFGMGFETVGDFAADGSLGLFSLMEHPKKDPYHIPSLNPYHISPDDIEYFISLAKSPGEQGIHEGGTQTKMRAVGLMGGHMGQQSQMGAQARESSAKMRSQTQMDTPMGMTVEMDMGHGSVNSPCLDRLDLFESSLDSPKPTIFDYVGLYREGPKRAMPRDSIPSSTSSHPEQMMRAASLQSYDDIGTVPAVASQGMARTDSLFSWQGDLKREPF